MNKVIFLIAVMGLIGALTGCGVSCSTYPLQSHELVEKTATSQLWDWMFKMDKEAIKNGN